MEGDAYYSTCWTDLANSKWEVAHRKHRIPAVKCFHRLVILGCFRILHRQRDSTEERCLWLIAQRLLFSMWTFYRSIARIGAPTVWMDHLVSRHGPCCSYALWFHFNWNSIHSRQVFRPSQVLPCGIVVKPVDMQSQRTHISTVRRSIYSFRRGEVVIRRKKTILGNLKLALFKWHVVSEL